MGNIEMDSITIYISRISRSRHTALCSLSLPSAVCRVCECELFCHCVAVSLSVLLAMCVCSGFWFWLAVFCMGVLCSFCFDFLNPRIPLGRATRSSYGGVFATHHASWLVESYVSSPAEWPCEHACEYT